MNNKSANNKKKNPNDIIYTPKSIALEMIHMIDDYKDKTVLDPCRGGGVFYDNLPDECIKEYCEITEEKDFFAYNKDVDIIIGNPPYSLWTKWIEHTIKLNPQYICYIMNIYNLTPPRIKQLEDGGYGIVKLKMCKIPWWFGCSFLVLLKKNSTSIIDIYTKPILCDICNKRCKRGLQGNGMNECTNLSKDT